MSTMTPSETREWTDRLHRQINAATDRERKLFLERRARTMPLRCESCGRAPVPTHDPHAIPHCCRHPKRDMLQWIATLANAEWYIEQQCAAAGPESVEEWIESGSPLSYNNVSRGDLRLVWDLRSSWPLFPWPPKRTAGTSARLFGKPWTALDAAVPHEPTDCTYAADRDRQESRLAGGFEWMHTVGYGDLDEAVTQPAPSASISNHTHGSGIHMRMCDPGRRARGECRCFAFRCEPCREAAGE